MNQMEGRGLQATLSQLLPDIAHSIMCYMLNINKKLFICELPFKLFSTSVFLKQNVLMHSKMHLSVIWKFYMSYNCINSKAHLCARINCSNGVSKI